MIVDDVAKLAQSCTKSLPVVVLGSGASMPHNIRGMGALSEVLQDELQAEDPERDAWAKICEALADGNGLEEALQKTTPPPSLVKKIVEITWKTIASDDISLLERAAAGDENFPLNVLIRHLFTSTNSTIHIVTPNYDRVAEYATDVADHIHMTGFVPGLIRRREGKSTISIQKGSNPLRIVRIWKVHGSLDWFENRHGQVFSLPMTRSLPPGFTPMIVTPGVSKYERTHDEPFRSAIQGADAALEAANAVLCVGYGFRDRHIQAKLVERCQQKNIPIVVLARTLTDDSKTFVKKYGGRAYLAMEDDPKGTRVFTHNEPKGQLIEGRKFWSFNDFNKIAI